MRPSLHITEAITGALQHGVLPAGELTSQVTSKTSASSATVRRGLDELRNEIVVIGKARARRYGLAHDIGSGSAWFLGTVAASGQVSTLGTLHALASGQWYLEPSVGVPTDILWWGSRNGVFDGLPWYLDTLRPQGFLGRVFGSVAHSALPSLPADIGLWSDEQVVRAALALGNDLPGNLVLGTPQIQRIQMAALEEALQREPQLSGNMESLRDWVDAIIAGQAVGSSAGGEQPKFVYTGTNESGLAFHKLVKFSPALTSPGAVRWSDLLIAEHVANQVLADYGFKVAHTSVHITDNRTYLESDRFDRVGMKGRLGLSPLMAPAAFAGSDLKSWAESVQMLTDKGLLEAGCPAQAAWLESFGQAIGNTDMHHGNLSIMGSWDAKWSLAPVYDMVPMIYAPGRTLEVTQDFREIRIGGMESGSPQEAAGRFWETLSAHHLVSEGFKKISLRHADVLNHVSLVGNIAPDCLAS